MRPIRNPNWSTSGMRVTLSYLKRIQHDYERNLVNQTNLDSLTLKINRVPDPLSD